MTKSISIFNNKGGVGKSTLTYHLGCALNEMGVKTLMIDLDPQSNLSLFCLNDQEIEEIWNAEEDFISDYQVAKSNRAPDEFNAINSSVRSIHYILKPVEDGQSDEIELPPPHWAFEHLALLPGRLSLHLYENKVAKLWSEAFLGEPQALRTVTAIRNIYKKYAENHGFEVILLDTSPSLGLLNKVLISTSDAFIIPCAPDMFSDYGIKNIGNALSVWEKEFTTMYSLLPDVKRSNLKEKYVKLLGYTIYNAKRRGDANNSLKIAKAHYNWAQKLPNTVEKYLPKTCYQHLTTRQLKTSIGENSVIYGHGTLPTMSQKYKNPMWNIPSLSNLGSDKSTISGNRDDYESTKADYLLYAQDVLERLKKVDR